MSGKAVSRALRAHFTIDAACLFTDTLFSDHSDIVGKIFTFDKNDIGQLLKKVLDGTGTSEEITSNKALVSTTKEVNNVKLTKRTVRLWIQYTCISTINSSEQRGPAIGCCISNPWNKCYIYSHLQVTSTTLNVRDFICK